MKYSTVITIIILLCVFKINAQKQQIPVRTDISCLNYNAAVVCQLFLDVYGDEVVESWLTAKRRVGFQWTVDSLGRILKFESLRTTKPLLSQAQEQKMETYIQTHDVYLCFCYGDPCLGEDDLERIAEWAKLDIRLKVKDGRELKLFVPFNNDLIRDYEDIRKKGAERGKKISQTQYLRYIINKVFKNAHY